MASRMQTTLIGSGIQVTENVYERLKDKFCFSEKMSTNIKGKGETTTYLLLDNKDNENQNEMIKMTMMNKMNDVRKHESSLSSLSSNFNNFLKENTNKCMADDNFSIDNENIVKLKSNKVDDVNSLTYEILNDSDFEDDNNSLSNSSFNIFEMNVMNRSVSTKVKTNTENNLQSHINNEIALNINQQIKNVLTNYDQIQNLQNITNSSITSLHNNDSHMGEYLREENDKIIDSDDELYNEEKPSLIKGIINRTKSYQLKSRANSTKPKHDNEESDNAPPTHKNFNLHTLKYFHDKNRSFNSSDLYSTKSMDTNDNLSADYLSDYGMIENKISKCIGKKRSVFKSFHSFKQKSDNNLSKPLHKGSKTDSYMLNTNVSHPLLNTVKDSYNKGLCVSTNAF